MINKNDIYFDNQDNLRLDLYLLLKYNEFSRSFIASAIKKGFVTVNGDKSIKPSYKVKSMDSVVFDIPNSRQAIMQDDFENVVPTKMNLDVVFEDDDLLVINKISGMSTHPSHGHLNDTLLNGVHSYLHADSKEVLHSRKHMVHRLDKDTSGLILFAKTDKMLWWLHRQFAERRINKQYYALGLSSKKYDLNENFTVEGYIERSRREKKIYMFSNKYGKWTKTDFKPVKNFVIKEGKLQQFLLLVECKPQTGRTHQIRVHLKYSNLPIWGDVLYSSDKQLNFVDDFCYKNNIKNRLFLHAYKLDFESYNGKEYHFEIPLSSELNNLISKIDEI